MYIYIRTRIAFNDKNVVDYKVNDGSVLLIGPSTLSL